MISAPIIMIVNTNAVALSAEFFWAFLAFIVIAVAGLWVMTKEEK